MRIGQGYDVHKLVSGRELILCGEHIPHDTGLDGHSDADVAVHALCDALLGAAAMGDIGRHFPDTDEQYKGICSINLLKDVCLKLKSAGKKIENIDVTIIAQKPKLLPYIENMIANLSEAMNLEKGNINVKATTTERLGFEGRGEGISAMAIVLLK